MTDQNPDQIPDLTMGEGMQGPAYTPPIPDTPASAMQNIQTSDVWKAGLQRMVGADPLIGETAERVIQQYPMMSRDMVAGLLYSGQINVISPALLDLLAEEDRLAQESASSAGFWQQAYGGLKATSRHIQIGADDLYNSSPIFSIPRTIINQRQGQSWGDAWEESLDSTAKNAIILKRLGFEVGYGTGFFASEDTVVRDEFFFATVKENILNGSFEGSAEEQILAATQEAMIQQIERGGFNPFGMARNQWQSQEITRTIDGVDYSVPYSPGAFTLLPFTTPGTRSYDTFSGLVDGIFRVTMEPIDVPMDYAGDMIRHATNPLVRRGLSGYRTRAMADILEEQLGIKVALEPIRIEHDGFETAAKGATTPQIDEVTGRTPASIDLDRTDDHYQLRMDNRHKDDVWDLEGEYATYTQPYEDMGVKPSDVRRELDARGGRSAEAFLTVEHELQHVDQNELWFGIRTSEDGTRFVDYTQVTDAAPDDVKRLVAGIMDEGNSPEKIGKIADEGRAVTNRMSNLKGEADEIRKSMKGMSPPQRKAARREIDRLEKELVSSTDRHKVLQGQMDETVAAYNASFDELQHFLESEAIKKAWGNMLDGSWKAEKMHAAYRRKAGLSKLLRPFAGAPDVDTWLKSKLGQRTLNHLSRLDNIETLRKRLPYLDERDIVRIADTTDKGVIQNIIQDAFYGTNVPGGTRPTVGRVTNTMTRGLDAWQQTERFIGGPVGKAMTAMGHYGSRLRTSVGNTLLSSTDLKQTLDTINSELATANVPRAEINKVQAMAIRGHGRYVTIDLISQRIEELTTEAMLKKSSLYSKEEIAGIWSEWRGYDILNRHYWTSNAGKDRNWIFQNGRFRKASDLEAGKVRPEAFMEAQFSQTTRTMPPIRSMRRLTSRQRTGYETVRKVLKNRPSNVAGWEPLGFRPTGIMDFGDWSFGVWRDLQLMRGGWALRILPEEQLRFGAAGYSNLFSHPLDYFISMMNRMDFTIKGDDLTLDQVMRTQEALGTGTMRDLRTPPHMVSRDDFVMANRLQHPKQYWGGLTHEFIMSSSDPVVGRVASMGREKALLFFRTDEGKEVISKIANDAAVGGSLGRIIRPEELERYLDVVEIRIAQITGGDGLWLNPETGQWIDSMDQAKPKASDRVAYPNETELHKAMVEAAGGDTDVLVGMTHRSRGDLEAALNELRGYNLDELEAAGRSGVVTRQGNDDLRGLLGSRELDDIKIEKDMPFAEARVIDKKLETAFDSRGVEPPQNWPVAKGELEDAGAKTLRNKVTDEFFRWFNSIPSQTLNRQPFFQQSFGVKVAEVYYYGDSELRGAIDELRAMNESFDIAMGVGERKLFRDLDVPGNQPAQDVIRRRPETIEVDSSETPLAVYEELVQRGMYDRIPLADDPEGYATAALGEAILDAGGQEGQEMWTKGIYLQRQNRVSKPYTGFENRLFSSTTERRPAQEWIDAHGPMSNRYGTLSRSSGVNESVIEDLVENNRVIRNDEILAELDPIVADTFASEIEAMQTLRAWEIDPAKVGSDQMQDAAETLGWTRQRSSGGIGLDPERAAGPATITYGPYTEVFDVERFEPQLREHIEVEGDLEQIYTIREDRSPHLAAMDEDIVTVFNNARNKTRFKTALPTYQWLHEGEKKAQKFFKTLEELGESLPPASALELDNSVSNAGINAWGTQIRDMDRREIVTDWIVAQYAKGGDEWWMEFTTHYHDTFGLMRVRQRPFVAEPLLPGSPRQYLAMDEGFSPEIAEEMSRWVLGLFDDPTQLSTGNALPPLQRQIIERELGRKMTDDEAHELMTLIDERNYQPEEVLLNHTPIDPLGRFPRETVMGMMNRGVMADTPRTAGEIALIIEANTLPLPANQYSFGAFHGSFRNHMPTAKTLDGQWDEWDEFLTFELDPGERLAVEAVSKNLEFDGTLTTMGPDGEVALIRDLPTWIASPQFRALSYHTNIKLQKTFGDFTNWFQKNSGIAGFDPNDAGGLVEDADFIKFVTEFLEYEEASTFVSAGSYRTGRVSEPTPIADLLDEALEEYAFNPTELYVDYRRLSTELRETIEEYEKGAAVLNIGNDSKEVFGFRFGDRIPTDRAKMGDLELDFRGVPQEDRNAAAQRVWNAPKDRTMYDQAEAGNPNKYKNSSASVVNELEELMKAAKRDAIEETKDLFYDLSNKSNVADAAKFIFPFGDAWYEVLSRWAKIQNPTISGGQSFRNVRRIQQPMKAGQQSGFLSTNEYGEEVFNWNITAGSLLNSYIPNGANVHLQGKVPISSLMFIDPTARGVFAPGVSPIIQVAAQFTEPDTSNIPLFSDGMAWLAYGSKDDYRPGEINEFGDVAQGFMPTVFNRLISAVFDESAREALGNTKLRLFQSIGISGDPEYNIMTNPENARKAWDIANTAGSWLGWLRVLDGWWMPGQPQFTTEMKFEEAGQTMTLEETLEAASKLGPESQYRITSIVRANSEYRLARELFGEAEADMYMIERYGILPAMLQSASVGLVERPTTWGGVQHIDDNEWLNEAAPFTMAWTIPPDADPTFASRAWNNLFGEYLMVEGVENKPIRQNRSPSELLQTIQRGMGYDQIRHQTAQYDRAVEVLRNRYGANYANDLAYRVEKNELDRIKRDNIEGIYTEFPNVRPSNTGIIGAPQGVMVRRFVDEILDVGTQGTDANDAFRENMPELADVAEQYAIWLRKMEAFSRAMDSGEASGEWWSNSEAPNAQILRTLLADQVQSYYRSLPANSHQREYAKKLNERLLDPLIKEWEWIDSAWSFEVEAYPSVTFADTFGPEETP